MLDPGPGGAASGPEEGAANLAVAVAAAAALRLALGDDIEVALTRRDASRVGYDAGRPILSEADVAIRIEHGSEAAVTIGQRASASTRELGRLLASGLRRELRLDVPLRRDSYRKLLRQVPTVVLASLPHSSDVLKNARTIAATLAAHVTAEALAVPSR